MKKYLANIYIMFVFIGANLLYANGLKAYQHNKVIQLADYKTGKYLTNRSSLILNNVKVELYSIVNNEDPYWKRSSYRYEIVANGKRLYSGGTNNTHTKLGYELFNKSLANEPSFVHELYIGKTKVGWLYGWNKHADNKDNVANYSDYGYSHGYGTDFSVARLLIPIVDKNNQIKIFSKYLQGVKFQDIADLLDIDDNEIKIVPTEDEQSIFGSGAITGYYYLPSPIISIKSINGDIKVTEEELKITDKLIKNDPYYAFSIAYHNNDIYSMKKAYDLLKHTLEIDMKSSNECNEYKKNLNDFKVDGYISMKKFWDSFKYGSHYDVMKCFNEKYNAIFIRTGIIPTQKFIDEFFEKSLGGQ